MWAHVVICGTDDRVMSSVKLRGRQSCLQAGFPAGHRRHVAAEGPALRRFFDADELAHVALEVDVFDDPRHSARRDVPLGRLLGAHLRSQALDLAHLLLQVNAAPPRIRFLVHGIKL